MGINTKVKQDYLKIGKIFAVIIGILLIVFSFLLLSKDFKFNDKAVEVLATVTNVETPGGKAVESGKPLDQRLEVQYNVNGVQYTSTIENYSAKNRAKKNDVIKVYYNSENPTEIKTTKDNNIFGYVLIVIGVVFIALGLLFKHE